MTPGTAAASDRDLTASPQRAVLVEQVRLIYGVLGRSSWSTLALSLFVAWVLRQLGTPIAIWLVAQTLLKLSEQIEIRWFIRDEAITAHPERMVRRLMVTQSLHAAGWGALLWIAAAEAQPDQFIFVVMAIGGVLSGGITSYSPLPRVHLAYICTFIVVELVSFVALWLTAGSNPYFTYMPLLMIIYCLGTYSNTTVAGQTYQRTIELSFRNAELARSLEREVERARRAQAEADEANAAKSTFLASASHDLRQPIHALGLFLALLDRSRLDDVQRDTMNQALAALRASSEMLDALLDFSRAEAGVIVPQWQSFAIGPILRQIEEETGSTADDRQLFYRTRDSDLWVRSDPTLVKLILQNFVTNAIRYTVTGGLLVGCRRRGTVVRVEVWDTGIGIPKDHHEAIFADFLQLSNPERDRRKGLGLGLAIARRLADLIGARITLSSKPGQGSVFGLELPASVATPPLETQPQPAVVPAFKRSGDRVLILEDDEAVRQGLCALLADAGFDAVGCETIAEACAAARREAPDLAICDFRLRNGENGIEAARRLRALAGQELPVLLITGDTHPTRLAEAARADLTVLHKPVPADLLLKAIGNSMTVPLAEHAAAEDG
ncbi:hybrid sensor histidine kinase/response regulator [Novosphingobium sp. EMRT-2]|uniref:ATP-binding response regulator n=1 Tax=Novosphingobium sp. EMRT-2 TaxID=2571749 RepID=UPI0010BD7A32|nr:hybrid sensor histidine kinase/response regulator [Novosphingobium sp. EMRT-2]QCI94810.1 response regulator [Novosphingobium sp. EMRT-2]